MRLTKKDIEAGLILASRFEQNVADTELLEAFECSFSTPEGELIGRRMWLVMQCAGLVEENEHPDDPAARDIGQDRALAVLRFALGVMWHANGMRFPLFDSLAGTRVITGSAPFNEMGWEIFGLDIEFVREFRSLLDGLSYQSKKRVLLLAESALVAFSAEQVLETELDAITFADEVEEWLEDET